MYNISRYYYMTDRIVEDKIYFTNDLHDKTLQELIGFNLSDTNSLNSKINSLEYKKYFAIPKSQVIHLSTTYPGLLIGSGYSHPALTGEDDKIDSDYQLGFFFDHTTGMPVIPGSSVKGKLKSVFPKNKNDVYYESKLNYIKSILEEKNISIPNLESDWKEIFFERKQVFFDAYITKAPSKLFEDDYITPHPRLFGNPTPLKFLKIAPEVQFTFQFRLKEYSLEKPIIDAGQIKEIFKQIILDFGMGAKTNVGYGNFKEVK
jgi:CRISPR-associated protein Cmr6